MIIPTVSCGKCWGCTHGLRHICDTIKFLGIQYNGGFAEYAAVPIENIRALPQSLPFEIAVLAEPVAVGIHAVSFVENIDKKNVLVFGAGPIGLMTAIIARLRGAKVIIAEMQAERKKKAEEFGFTAIDPSATDPQEIKNTFTSSVGFDAFFDCAGHPSTFNLMIATAKQRSQVVIVATYKQPPAIDIFMMSRKEMHIDISWTYFDSECEQAINLLNETTTRELFKPLITHVFPLAETETAMKQFIHGGDTLKVSIRTGSV